jgi:hypothetical protein
VKSLRQRDWHSLDFPLDQLAMEVSGESQETICAMTVGFESQCLDLVPTRNRKVE